MLCFKLEEILHASYPLDNMKDKLFCSVTLKKM